MHRFYLPPDQCQDSVVQLTERDARHAVKVLRIRPDDRFSVLDGIGHELHCQVESAEKANVHARVLSRNNIPPLPFELQLVQAVTKGKSMDLIIQKATELGASSVIPVLSERSIVHCDEDEANAKQEKWQTIAIEAMKQCGQAYIPRIEKPRSLNATLGSPSIDRSSLSLVASLQPGAGHPRTHIVQHAKEHGDRPRKLTLWIGPEGDFTPAEINAIKASGALPVTLGPLILRSETAALYILSAMNYELQTEFEE